MTKPVIVTRAGKGSALTWTEGDSNLTNLRDATIGITDGTNSGTLDLNDQLTVSASGSATVNYNNSTKTLTIGASSSVPTHLTNGSYELALNTDGTVTVPTSSVSGTPARIQSESGKNLQLNAGGSIFTLGYDGTLATPYNVKLTTSGIQFSDSSTQTTAFTGHVSWSNVDSKPSFANVAETGNYNDLTNKPTIPVLPSNAAGVLTNDGSGTLSWAAASGGGGGIKTAMIQAVNGSNQPYGGIWFPSTSGSPTLTSNYWSVITDGGTGITTSGKTFIIPAGTWIIKICANYTSSSNYGDFVIYNESTSSSITSYGALNYPSSGYGAWYGTICYVITVGSSTTLSLRTTNGYSSWGIAPRDGLIEVTKLA